MTMEEIAFFALSTVMWAGIVAVLCNLAYWRGHRAGRSAGQDAMLKAWNPAARVVVPEPLFLERRGAGGEQYFDGDGLLHEDDFKPTVIA